MWSNGNPLPSGRYPLPPILPPAEHPRLLLRKGLIPGLLENLTAAQNRKALKAWQALLTEKTDGVLPPPSPGKDNFDAGLLTAFEAWSLHYVLYRDQSAGKKAVKAILSFLKTCVYDGLPDNCRHMGQTIFTAAEIYDWCYPLLTAAEKLEITALCEETAAKMEIGYPPVRQGAVCGHAGEAQLMRNLLSFAIAVYDERPDIYHFCAGRFFSEFIRPRNDWCRSHSHHQGIAYGSYRYGWDLWAAWIIKRMSGEELYDREMGLVPYEWIYSRRPDGQMLRIGDDFTEYKERFSYWTNPMVPLFLAANYYEDAYLKGEFQREMALVDGFPQENDTLTPVQFLLLNNPALDGEPVEPLPKTHYFPSPYGAMITRTGWGAGTDDTLVFMKIGERWGANHNHLDAGHFQIYRKGILASDSGFYDRYGSLHDRDYSKRTIAHNTLLLYDPDEIIEGNPPHLNDGGQRFPNGGREPATYEEWTSGAYDTGKVLSHAFSDAFCILSGDINAAYGKKAEKVIRSMMFFPALDAASQSVFLVFDQVISAKADTRVTWLLHTQTEPQIEENRIYVQNGEGSMVVESLLPPNPQIRTVGGDGQEFWVNDRNLAPETPIPPGVEAGWGRVEVSPSDTEKETFFLHLFTLGQLKAAAQVQEDKEFFRLVCPSVTVVLVKDALQPPGSLAILGLPEQRLLVAGLSKGEWKLNGKPVQAEEGVLYLEAPPKNLVLKHHEAKDPD